MNLDEFETKYQNQLESALNQLQTAILLLGQLETKLTNVGLDLQNLSKTVEEFVIQQRDE
ncbi:MAG: hypothetical protein JO235_02635 [Chroococcidiopsidaceae cyanobacterium CP_BM_RX_35]|nr:hypothetical protein [Chroococcidiopsidaceae cyanobacterium CP_BM_RX_35]